MEFYGDISGHFRNILTQPESVCVVAVVGGERPDCYRCARRAVKRVTNLDEAKWYDLKHTEKRRFMDCFDDNCPPLVFGYASFTKQSIESVARYHLLHQDVTFPPAWDLALRGFAYAEILMEIAPETNPTQFHFDRFNSTTQSDAIAQTIEDELPHIDANHHTSAQKPGIQSADCLAGAIGEQERGGEPWLDFISNERAITDCGYWTLPRLEVELSEV